MKPALISIAALLAATPAFAQSARDIGRADADGDGQITRTEFDALRVAGFTRLDANGDGYLTTEETQAAGSRGQRFTRADGNGDGRVSRQEFLDQPARAFIRFDANRDNVLDADEVGRLREAMQRSAS